MEHEKVPRAQKNNKHDESGCISLNERIDSINKNSKESKKVKEGEYPVAAVLHGSQHWEDSEIFERRVAKGSGRRLETGLSNAKVD